MDRKLHLICLRSILPSPVTRDPESDVTWLVPVRRRQLLTPWGLLAVFRKNFRVAVASWAGNRTWPSWIAKAADWLIVFNAPGRTLAETIVKPIARGCFQSYENVRMATLVEDPSHLHADGSRAELTEVPVEHNRRPANWPRLGPQRIHVNAKCLACRPLHG
jgi:hypothetical protein